MSCNELALPCGHVYGACLIGEHLMAYTTHGHHIPGSVMGSITDAPDNRARCGGVNICPKCKAEVREHNIMIGKPTDFQAKAKDIVTDYVDALQRQNYPTAGRPVYSVYVVWFAKTLQNWKAILGTTLPDERLFEVTYDGDQQMAYVDVYKKQENFSVSLNS